MLILTFGAWTSCPPGNEWNFTESGYICKELSMTNIFYRKCWKKYVGAFLNAYWPWSLGIIKWSVVIWAGSCLQLFYAIPLAWDFPLQGLMGLALKGQGSTASCVVQLLLLAQIFCDLCFTLNSYIQLRSRFRVTCYGIFTWASSWSF